MKTSVIDVSDMLSVLSVLGVEERIGEVPGVESVTVNFAAANATVRFDETRLNPADIKSDVRQGAYDTDAAPSSAAGPDHEGHASGDAAAPTPEPGAVPPAEQNVPGGTAKPGSQGPGSADPGPAAAGPKAAATPEPAPANAPEAAAAQPPGEPEKA
jgi:P-type Cu2+ transporter